MPTTSISYRPATPFDAPRIAALHARSWQQHYRGAMTDGFLNGEVHADRLRVWTERFSHPDEKLHVMLAEDGKTLVAFCCLLIDYDPEHGTLLDNLHVRDGYQGRGIGRRLMRWAAVTTLAHDPEGRLYLWVLKSNTAAAAVYRHLGGKMGVTELHHLESGYAEGLEATRVHFSAMDLV